MFFAVGKRVNCDGDSGDIVQVLFAPDQDWFDFDFFEIYIDHKVLLVPTGIFSDVTK